MLAVRIGRPIDDSLQTGFDDSARARRRATLGRAGLERYVKGRAASSLACSFQSLDLGVRAASCTMPAPCHDGLPGYDDSTNCRIWMSGAHALARLTHRLAHEFFICRHSLAASARPLLQSIENLR